MINNYFPNIVDTHFTAEMESELDQIEAGKQEWVQVIDRFYQPFKAEVDKAEIQIEKVQIKDEPAGFDCEVCGSPMVIKLGRFGKFYACSNFPDCRHTAAIVKEFDQVIPGFEDDAFLTGQDSTILDISGSKAKILRQGSITKADLIAQVPELSFEDDELPQ